MENADAISVGIVDGQVVTTIHYGGKTLSFLMSPEEAAVFVQSLRSAAAALIALRN